MESGINKKPNILVLTSFLSNDNSSKMIKDVAKSLEDDYNVDVLSKYPAEVEGLNIYSAYNNYERFIINILLRFKAKFFYYKSKFIKANNNISKDYHFFGLNEMKPPVNPNRITGRIKKDYDFVLVFFWQGLITSKTLKDIHDKINKPILLMAADMFPMTGGCSYFWDCDRLKDSCGKCPGLSSTIDHDITRINFLYKKKMISNINCIILGNTWQINHANKSTLFNNLGEIYPIVDENVFRQRDKKMLKQKFNYSNKIILFFGALGVHDPRKGFKYLVESLNLLHNYRPDLVKNIVLLVAGTGEEISELNHYEVNYTGHLSFDELAEYYALSDVFLCPSVQDAGPMMLNQALMCGTPAVAFNIGTACDIINEDTGYLAKYRNSEDFCKGIITLITKSNDELLNIQEECRIQSLKRSSYKAFRDKIIFAYNEIKKVDK
ncbi:glycosyltransferase [Flavobacterium sp. 1355]|uniref:glycosyltransferase n=1 Tax=Flavobacterium sp. 1355 TaxID=2806571 RepID=UPI001AE81100|nr:glycosyltransferase [Flavobacterium sp. 1355]MBP1224035.1 glycosyltransferase involved in cell wall biosynthesis [Flavobacterium sp. 1355]